MSKLYYPFNCEVDLEEDEFNEFKCHGNFASDEMVLMPNITRSRSAISRSFASFLNEGNGGIIHLGITDDGRAVGMNMNADRADHILLNLRDLCLRYSPPVPAFMYFLEFIPILMPNDDVENLHEYSREDVTGAEKTHVFRQSGCFCQNTEVKNKCVVRVHIRAWEATLLPGLNPTKCRLPPIYENEDGDLYIRKLASVQKITSEDVIRRSIFIVRTWYSQQLNEFNLFDVYLYA